MSIEEIEARLLAAIRDIGRLREQERALDMPPRSEHLAEQLRDLLTRLVSVKAQLSGYSGGIMAGGWCPTCGHGEILQNGVCPGCRGIRRSA
jgi:hypothetical protein